MKIVCQEDLRQNKERPAIDTNAEMTEMLELPGNSFNAAMIKMHPC